MINYAIIVAGGKGKRFSDKIKKQFFKIGSKTILDLTIEKFDSHPLIDRIILVISEKDRYKLDNFKKIYKVVSSGKERKFSVYNGLKAIKEDIDFEDKILIHDGVRPFVSKELISNIIKALDVYKCVVPAVKIYDTVKELKGNVIFKTLNREKIVKVQTPQGFKGELLNIFLENVVKDFNFTDDASIFEHCGIDVNVIDGEKANIKITTKEDIMGVSSRLNIGFGYDVHRFCKDRDLYLGGVKIDYKYGLQGHSDADVLIHSIIDGILGATGSGDIGELFPDTDNSFKNIRSTQLLRIVVEKIEKNYIINNIDCTVVCEEPKLKDYKNLIKKKLSEIMKIPEECINIKGKTTEGLGFEGEKQGISAYSIVSVIKLI